MGEHAYLHEPAPEHVKWTIWADTCVLLDFDTTISFAKNAAQGERVLEDTRLLMRSAAWMGLAFDLRTEVSATAGYEAGRKLRQESAPGTLDGAWTHLTANIVRDYVCLGWQVHHTPDGEVTDPAVVNKHRNNAHDDFMIEVCRNKGKPLVTSDDKAYKKAKRAGATVLRPEEYAHRVIPFEKARALFMRRLDHGILMFLTRHVGANHAAENTALMRNAYLWIWRA
jgi:hypothetical protein